MLLTKINFFYNVCHRFVGDCQIPLACDLFLEAKGREILMKNLYRNFVLHVCSLFDFGLMSAVGMYTTLQKLQEIASADDLKAGERVGGGRGAVGSNEPKRVLQQAWQAQRERWLASRKAGEPSLARSSKAEAANAS